MADMVEIEECHYCGRPTKTINGHCKYCGNYKGEMGFINEEKTGD